MVSVGYVGFLMKKKRVDPKKKTLFFFSAFNQKEKRVKTLHTLHSCTNPTFEKISV